MSDLVRVARTDQVTSGQRRLVRVNGQEIAVFNHEGTIYAISNTCPHSTGPLVEGRLFGTMITCPWHGAQFDITTGLCHGGPATSDVTTYAVQIKDNAIFLEVT
jgi:nitrite reductase/ring-hydroxylating ferredoxin subunit